MDAIFLKLDDIKGESQADGFNDQIEIMSTATTWRCR